MPGLAGLMGLALARPRAWLAGCAALTLALGLGLLKLELRTDGAAIHPIGNAAVERTRADRRTFHENEQVIVLMASRPGGAAVESPAGLRRLKTLQASIETLPGVRANRVRSLATVIEPRPDVPLILTRRLLDEIPTGDFDAGELQRRIRMSPLAPGLFLSAGGRAAAFYVPAANDGDRPRLVAALERWVNQHRSVDFDLRLTGPVVAEVRLGRAVLRDLARLVPLMVATVAAALWLCLRSFGGVVVAMVEILMVLIWTLGVMGLCGVPVTLVTSILPVLLMSVAVTDEIHVLERFRAYLHRSSESGSSSAGGRRRAMESALRDVAQPIVLTSITTSIAFLSFLASATAPVRHFGAFAALGVLLAMLLSFSFVPALALTVPARWYRETGPAARWRRAAFRRPCPAAAGAAAAILFPLLAIAVAGWLRLTVQDSWVDNFDPESELVAAEAAFNSEFWGSYRFDLVLTAPEALFFHRGEGLRLTAELARRAAAGPHVGGVMSHAIVYQQVADAHHGGTPAWQLSAERLRGIARLLYRVQANTDLDQVLRSDGSQARLRLFVRDADYARAVELERYLEGVLPAVLAGSGVRAHASGDLPLARAVVDAVVGNVLRSVGWTLVGVFGLLAVLAGGVRAAAVSLAPLAASVTILLGAMGHAGIPFGIATSLFIAVALGVGVDFAIHFRHAYRRQRRAGLDHRRALEATGASAGRAIRWNAVVLAGGCLILAFSALRPIQSLGLLLAAAMVTCYWSTRLLLPGLLRREVGG